MALIKDADIAALLSTYGVAGVSLAVLQPDGAGDASIATQVAGVAEKRSEPIPVYDSTYFQICSLSKPIAAVVALQYFKHCGISMDASVNALLAQVGSPFRFRAAEGCDPSWADEVTITHLIDHTGPQMHYVNGVPREHEFPDVIHLVSGTAEKPAPYGYAPLDVRKKPGTTFGYSGGGFIVLQHLMELREKAPISEIVGRHLKACGNACHLGLSFAFEVPGKPHADGHRDTGEAVVGGRLNFPPLAAGAIGSAAGLADWLRQVALAYQRPEGCGGISHDAARLLLASRPDIGSEAFMRSRMGLGMFVFNVTSSEPSRPNRWMLHQAANDGFRGVLLVCFDGPDADNGPRGLVVFANGDNQAMLLVAAVTRLLLSSPKAFNPPIEGFDLSRVASMEGGFKTEGMKQAEIVNLGFRDLVLGAFKRAPEPDDEQEVKRAKA